MAHSPQRSRERVVAILLFCALCGVLLGLGARDLRFVDALVLRIQPNEGITLRAALPDAGLAAVVLDVYGVRDGGNYLEEASGKPLPDLVRTDKQPVDLRLRELKTEHAYARAELQRLERRLTANAAAVDPQALQQARQRLALAAGEVEPLAAHVDPSLCRSRVGERPCGHVSI